MNEIVDIICDVGVLRRAQSINGWGREGEVYRSYPWILTKIFLALATGTDGDGGWGMGIGGWGDGHW